MAESHDSGNGDEESAETDGSENVAAAAEDMFSDFVHPVERALQEQSAAAFDQLDKGQMYYVLCELSGTEWTEGHPDDHSGTVKKTKLQKILTNLFAGEEVESGEQSELSEAIDEEVESAVEEADEEEVELTTGEEGADSRPTEDDFTKDELQEMAADADVSKSGSKADIWERLEEEEAV